jgi:hypothetical protein
MKADILTIKVDTPTITVENITQTVDIFTITVDTPNIRSHILTKTVDIRIITAHILTIIVDILPKAKLLNLSIFRSCTHNTWYFQEQFRDSAWD